jgi:hypothetical protein
MEDKETHGPSFNILNPKLVRNDPAISAFIFVTIIFTRMEIIEMELIRASVVLEATLETGRRRPQGCETSRLTRLTDNR